GALLHGFIKGVLFNPWIVCISLIAGGAVLHYVDGLDLQPRYHDATGFSLPVYLGIGICQCLAMIPGVSRSGATIVSAMLLGADRRSAAEFSFYLAMPTMAGAFFYDLYKNGAHMSSTNILIVAVGFVASFIAGWFVVKRLLDYVSGNGFDLFVWWRVIVGSLGLIGLALVGGGRRGAPAGHPATNPLAHEFFTWGRMPAPRPLLLRSFTSPYSCLS